MPKTLESYLDRYPGGPQSCCDCKNFKTVIPVVKGKIQFSKMRPAHCREGLLLRGSGEDGHGELYEPNYAINKTFWKRITDRVFLHDWRQANRCPEFIDMRGD
jgi:hypothetical protein